MGLGGWRGPGGRGLGTCRKRVYLRQRTSLCFAYAWKHTHCHIRKIMIFMNMKLFPEFYLVSPHDFNYFTGF